MLAKADITAANAAPWLQKMLYQNTTSRQFFMNPPETKNTLTNPRQRNVVQKEERTYVKFPLLQHRPNHQNRLLQPKGRRSILRRLPPCPRRRLRIRFGDRSFIQLYFSLETKSLHPIRLVGQLCWFEDVGGVEKHCDLSSVKG